MVRRVSLLALLLACNPGSSAPHVAPGPHASPVVPAPLAAPAAVPPAAPPAGAWAVRIGGQDFDQAEPVVVTRDGETLALAWGSDDLSIDTQVSGAPPQAAGSGVHRVRLGPLGELRGVDRIGEGFHTESVALAEDGDLTLVGIYGERASFTGHGERAVVRQGADGPSHPDAFIARVRPGGEVAWLRTFTGAEDQHLEHVVGLSGGDVVVAGSFAREGTLEGAARGKKISTHHRTRDPNWDLVLARIGSDGATRWTRVIGGPHTDAIRGLVGLPDGNLALLGLCQGLIEIDGIANDSALECDRESPVVLVAVYTPEGEFVRGRAYPDSLLGDPSDFAALSDGAVAVAGRFAGTLTPAGGPTLTSDGWPQPFFDGFVARFAVDLEFVWLRHLRGPRSTGADAVVGDRDGGVWVWTSAELDLAVGDGATYTKPLANGGHNAALLRFDRAGALVSAALQGGKPDAQNLGNGAIDPMLGEVRAADILLAPDGGLRLVGQFSVDAVLTVGDARLVLRTADNRGTLHLDAFIAAVPPPR